MMRNRVLFFYDLVLSKNAAHHQTNAHRYPVLETLARYHTMCYTVNISSHHANVQYDALFENIV